MLNESNKLRPGMVVTFSDFTYQALDSSIKTEPILGCLSLLTIQIQQVFSFDGLLLIIYKI